MTRRNGKGLLRDRRGAVAAWMALMLVMLLGVAALAVDMGFLWVLRNRLQATADASALAGVSQLTGTPDAAVVKAGAVAYAQKNMPPGGNGTVLTDPDVVLGHWDGATRTFTTNATGTAAPAGESTNAVKVTTRRAQANGNPAQLFFARVLGIQTADVTAEAIAEGVGGANNCFLDNGVLAGGRVTMGQDIRVWNGFCIGGRDGVGMGQDPLVEEGSYLWAYNLSYITYGQNPDFAPGSLTSCDPGGSYCDDAEGNPTLEPELANNVAQIITDLENGINWPTQIQNVVVGDDLPNNLVDGTAYIVNGDVSIGQDYSIRNVIIAVRGRIGWGQDGAIRNSDICTNGAIAIGIFATESITMGQDAWATGVQIAAGTDVTIGQDIRDLDATIQAAGNITLGQDPHFDGCEAALPLSGPAVGVRYRLVN